MSESRMRPLAVPPAAVQYACVQRDAYRIRRQKPGITGRWRAAVRGRAPRRARPRSARVIRSSSSAHRPIPRGRSAVQSVPVRQTIPTNLGWSLIDLPRAIRHERLDVFHAPAYTAPLRGTIPLVLTIHDVSYERHPEWYPYRRDAIRRWFYRRSARAADVIVTDSDFSRREIAAAYDLGPNHIRVVPLGVGSPFLTTTPPRSPANTKQPYVLHVGDLHVRRNLRTLVRALARLPICFRAHHASAARAGRRRPRRARPHRGRGSARKHSTFSSPERWTMTRSRPCTPVPQRSSIRRGTKASDCRCWRRWPAVRR